MELINKILCKLKLKNPPVREYKNPYAMDNQVKEALRKENLNTDSLIFSFLSDMLSFDQYIDTYVFFDEKGVYVASYLAEIQKAEGSKKLETKITLNSLKAIPLDEIDEIFLETNVSTGQLTYKYKEEYYPLIYFSIGKLAFAEKFQKVFNAFKNGKDYKQYINEDDSSHCIKCGAPIPKGLHYCSSCADNVSTLKRLFGFFKDFKWQIAFIAFSIIISSVFTVVVPKFSTQLLYDNVLNPNSTLSYNALFKALIALVLTIAGLKILNQIFTLVYQYIVAGILPKIVLNIKLKIFNAMQGLSVSFYTHKQTGSLMERITRDANNIYAFFVDGFPYLIGNGLKVAGILIIMLFTSYKLTLLVLAFAMLILVLYFPVSKKFRELHHKVWVQNSRITSKVSDNINGHRIIKAFSKENEELKEFNKISNGLMKAEVNSANAESTVFPILSIFIYFLGALVIGIGGVLAVTTEEITVGELLTFVVYLTMLQEPIDFLSWVVNWWARCIDSCQRVFEVLDTEPDIKEPENPVIIENIKGGVELKNVKFQYESAHPVIKNLSLKVKPGEMLGIVGKTGAGKTTISNLIARLYDPDEGTILIDNVDVKSLSRSQLRKAIGIVSQEIYLFMGTIADNIRYARPDATDEEVIAAAKAASAHDFILRLPDGYETRVGSGGSDLSGGERQRISIARTIIQNPKILILDEATAAMDTETERNIQNSLRKLQKDRTTIAIAHRLSTLKDADKLAVINNGEIEEFGTYSELMDKKGAYYKMFTMQQEALSFIDAADIKERDENDDEIRESQQEKSSNS